MGDFKADDLGPNDPSIDLVDIQQRVQHAVHYDDSILEPGDELFAGCASETVRQKSPQQGTRLQRLAEIVAGGRSKARLGGARQVGALFGRLERLRGVPALQKPFSQRDLTHAIEKTMDAAPEATGLLTTQ